MERYDSSLRFLYLYCRGLSRIRLCPSSLGLSCLPNLYFLGLGWLSNSSFLGLPCLANPSFLEFNWLSSLSFFNLTYSSNSRYFRLDWLSNSNTLSLTWLRYPFYLRRFFKNKNLNKKIIISITKMEHIVLFLFITKPWLNPMNQNLKRIEST